MSLRSRLTLAGGGAVFVALAIASLVMFFSVRSKLHDQIDVSLIQTAQNIATKLAATDSPKPAKAPTGKLATTGKLPAGSYGRSSNTTFPSGPLLGSNASGYFQIIPSVGAASEQGVGGTSSVQTSTNQNTTSTSSVTQTKDTSTSPSGKPTPTTTTPGKTLPTPNSFVPLTAIDSSVAAGLQPPSFRDVTYHGVAMRLYTMRLSSSGDGLVRTARPLTEANATIGRVRWLLIGLTLGGALAAALLGRLAPAAVLRPVRILAKAVQEVTTTRDLNQRIAVSGRDEVGGLAENFNAMLTALEDSQRAQQQLIADASHELRTPLTAHRTNIELLARPDLPPARRPHVLGAAVRGIEELSTLINDLIQAARNGRSVDARAPVALHELVARAVERARLRAPSLRFESRLDPYALSAAPTRLERAVDNVLDNAVKWSSAGGLIEVTLRAGLLIVRDHGPGIEPSDLPHVFDRFYRSAAARGLPGSGLGLAIVKHTVDDHDGSVSVANADGGGTVVALRFDRTAAG